MSISVGTAVGYLDLDTSKFKRALSDAQKQLSSFGDSSLSAGDKFKNFGSGLKTIGSSLTKTVTTPLLGIGTASVATAANFEKSMSQVAATMGMTAEEINNGSESYKKLEQAALDMGATTQFSASEASEALNYLALAGYDVDKSVSTLPTVLNLAAAGGLELGYASDVMTDAMSALSLETSQAENFVDQLAKTSQKSNTSVGQLGEAILTVGGTAKVLAGGTTELNTALGILADNGIKGAEGGTALRNIILALTPSTDKAVAAFKKLGVETYDANGNLKPINETFSEMNDKLKNLSQEERTRVLSDIFNKVDLKSVNALLANSGERFDELSGYIANADGAASDMANTMNNNLSGQLTLLKSALEGAAISIGEALMPMIKGLVEGINNLVNWFNSLNPGMQQTIIIVAGIAAAIGPALMVIGQMAIGIGVLIPIMTTLGTSIKTNLIAHIISLNTTMTATIIPALTSFASMIGGVVMSAISAVATFLTGTLIPALTATAVTIGAVTIPVWAVIAVFAALVAAGVLVYKNWDTIKAKCKEIWEGSIKPTIETVTKTISAFLEAAWNGTKAFLSTCWDLLKQLATSIWNGIKSVIETVCNGIKNIITTVWNGIKSITTTVWNGIKSLITTVVNSIKSVIQNVFNAVKSVVTTIWNSIKTVISSAWNGIKSVVSTGVNAVKSVITSVWSGLQSLLTAPFIAAKSVIDGILSGISSAISSVKSAISSVKSAASSVIDKVNPFKKSIEVAYIETPIDTYSMRSNTMDMAKRLVYSDNIAKTSIADSIVGVSNLVNKDLIKGNDTKGSSGNSVVINNTYNSPKPASIRELKRQDEIQMRRLAMQLGF